MTYDVSELRSLMGRTVQSWRGPGGLTEVGDGYWAVLVGPPSPDANMALVCSPAEAATKRVLDLIDMTGVPALLLLAGEATDEGLPEGWSEVGGLPFMAKDLRGLEDGFDARVRTATAADLPALTAVLADAYGMPAAIAQGCCTPAVLADGLTFWLLEEDGEVVSTVLTALLDDVVSVWCMGTPARHGRRGYGRALLGHVLSDAAHRGAVTGLLGATPAGEPLYASTGWEPLESWRIFAQGESAQFS
jgi:GNAT superfamily N-acetyltransferase